MRTDIYIAELSSVKIFAQTTQAKKITHCNSFDSILLGPSYEFKLNESIRFHRKLYINKKVHIKKLAL